MTAAPDVVGTNESALIMEVELPRIRRMTKERRMPKPAVVLKATPVWHREDVEAIARGEKPNGSRPLALVGLAEAAALLEVDKSQIGRWRRARKFPEPALDKRPTGQKWKPGSGLAATPLWWRRDIMDFKRRRAK